MLINIIDAPMGAGKTSAIINKIKLSAPDQRFVYVTPYLDEVDRIRNQLSDRNFAAPDREVFGTKKRAFDYMVEQNRNIATTHALFYRFLDSESFDKLSKRNYTLFIDEVSTPIDTISLYPRDVELLDELTETDHTNIMHVKPDIDYPEYGAKFSDELKMIEAGNVYRLNKHCLVTQMPLNNFICFKEIFLATYMFDCQLQKYYFDLFHTEYKTLNVVRDRDGNHYLTDSTVDYKWHETIKPLINLYSGKYNNIGNGKFDLSKGWYDKEDNAALVTKLGKNARNFFRNNECASKDAMWTSFVDYKDRATPHGYSGGFVSCNARAVNTYRNRTSVAYLINFFSNVSVKSYFAIHDIKIDDDKYALSEMLQFIWRSAIRDGKPINLYIPSSRMRGLLTDYLEGKIA